MNDEIMINCIVLSQIWIEKRGISGLLTWDGLPFGTISFYLLEWKVGLVMFEGSRNVI